jgi:hypothetical protein
MFSSSVAAAAAEHTRLKVSVHRVLREAVVAATFDI